jgi:hypothetical protein
MMDVRRPANGPHAAGRGELTWAFVIGLNVQQGSTKELPLLRLDRFSRRVSEAPEEDLVVVKRLVVEIAEELETRDPQLARLFELGFVLSMIAVVGDGVPRLFDDVEHLGASAMLTADSVRALCTSLRAARQGEHEGIIKDFFCAGFSFQPGAS